ncbi:glutamine synthetase family protein [Streptomyces sp. NPDC007095]|uniref:glutamine synthetase family protein n=1 Tax=Streptomyces sp. NPDC007095 TaxID=3154482 RepID=UPI0033F38826
MNDTRTEHSRSTPAGLLSLHDFHTAVERADITTVMLAVPDMMGRLKGKRLNAETFIERLQSGAEACAYILATDVDMSPVPGYDLTGWETGYGDLSVIPDLHSIRRLPYLPQTALIHADVAHASGELVEVAPRRMLQTQLERLSRLGLDPRVGLESEFVLFQAVPQQASPARYRRLRPVSPHNLDYALDHPPALSDFFQHLEDALHGADTPVESVKTEGAPGQVEVTFPYGEALRACDSYTVYRHAVRSIAARRGMTPTFMAAPKTGVGNGLHLHLSLWSGGSNAFAARPEEAQLPEPLYQAVAGLISALPHMAPLYAPTPNSYKRYVPHSFAPTRYTWGYDNRSCAIRITGHGEGRHVEVRLPGADANPYLALAAALAAIHHGLATEPELPPHTTGDAYQEDSALPVPRNLADAVADFDRSKTALAAFGAPVVRHYAHAAQHEIDEHRERVTDIELNRGFLRA